MAGTSWDFKIEFGLLRLFVATTMSQMECLITQACICADASRIAKVEEL
jgi:hypothetical protein